MDTIVTIKTVLITILGTIIGPWHGRGVQRLSLVVEYFDGPMAVTSIITYVRQMMYSIAIPGIFMSTFILTAEVSLKTTEKMIKY